MTTPTSTPGSNIEVDLQATNPRTFDVSEDYILEAKEGGIPDSGDLHARYDATELALVDQDSVTTWADETGNNYDLTAGTAPTYITNGINGKPSVRFDGVGDFLDVAFTTLPQPNHIFIVAQLQDAAETAAYWYYDSQSGEQNGLLVRADANGDEWSIIAGTPLDTGTVEDTNPRIHSSLYNGANSVHRLDGAQTITGDAGTEGLNGFTVGVRNDQALFAQIDVGEILIYPQDKSSVQSDVESYLADKWGITLS